MARVERTNYSRGYVVEFLDNDQEFCKSWLLLPAENLWPEALRGFLYILALAYIFLGIAIASDVFMCSIEVITSKKRKVIRWDEERQEKVEREVLLWNETVANLTLMALGSSAPEILLSTGEMVGELDQREAKDALGTFTIIGSAAFNLLIITAVCVLSVPTGTIKSIKEQGVFVVTSIWSIWAYVWMLLVVKYITPGQIDVWEAWVTLGYLPLFVGMAYATDRGLFCTKKKVGLEELEGGEEDADVPVRVVGHQHQHFTRSVPKELRVLEAEKAHRMSIVSLGAVGDRHVSEPSMSAAVPRRKSTVSRESTQMSARARFRHAAVSALMGNTNFHRLQDRGPRMADVVTKVKKIGDAIRQGTSPDGDLLGKFTFTSDRFAVLGSAGYLEIDVLYHRQIPAVSYIHPAAEPVTPELELSNTCLPAVCSSTTLPKTSGQPTHRFPGLETEEDGADAQCRAVVLTPHHGKDTSADTSVVRGSVTVDYETREGSAKSGHDFIFTQGTLAFDDSDYIKMLKVPIVHGKEPGADVEFYIILKNPKGGGGLGDPSIARITIMDDHEPGEFLFAEQDYYANMKSGQVTVQVVREHGFDGAVSLEYSTIDGTATGGKELKPGVDYIESHGLLQFDHGDTSGTITINVNKASVGCKNFIIAIRNPSTGAKVGIRSAVVVHLNKDELMERVEELLEDEEEEYITWGGQFAQAMTVSPEKDDEGNEVPPRWNHYIMHFLTFFWKVFCAMIPPTSIWGAWPSFIVSLVFIGMMTTVVEQLGKLLGCVVGLKTSVAGITIIALGTSLPDTFASRTAAVQDEHADAAIGNITGSNSVNVFLGLGLPWVLKTMHAVIYGYTFKVKTDNLTQSVLIFGIAGIICIATLLIRRKILGGELGGKRLSSKVVTSVFLLLLWLSYVVLSSLKAYELTPW